MPLPDQPTDPNPPGPSPPASALAFSFAHHLLRLRLRHPRLRLLRLCAGPHLRHRHRPLRHRHRLRLRPRLLRHRPTRRLALRPAGVRASSKMRGRRRFSGWATAISPGPASEHSQAVSFTVATDNPGLFASPPTVAPDGALRYTPAANAYGSATVSVVAHDDGGHGGRRRRCEWSCHVHDRQSSRSTTRQRARSVGTRPLSPSSGRSRCRDSRRARRGRQKRVGAARDVRGHDRQARPVSWCSRRSRPTGRSTTRLAFSGLGVATVTVRAVDDGGTANGGSDTSAPRTFTITIV